MSLLSVVTEVADIAGLPRPATVAANTQQLARQMMAIANEVLEELCRMPWPVLEVDYTFPTVIGQEAYALPADWQREVTDTAFLADQYYRLRGSLTPADWQRQKNALPSTLGRYKFRIYGNPLSIHVQPLPQKAEDIMLQYVTKNRVTGAGPVAKPLYTADTDVAIVPEELVRKGLKWRIKHAKGLEYAEDFNDYEASRGNMLAQQLAMGSMPVAYRGIGYYYGEDADCWYPGYIPETGYGA